MFNGFRFLSSEKFIYITLNAKYIRDIECEMTTIEHSFMDLAIFYSNRIGLRCVALGCNNLPKVPHIIMKHRAPSKCSVKKIPKQRKKSTIEQSKISFLRDFTTFTAMSLPLLHLYIIFKQR